VQNEKTDLVLLIEQAVLLSSLLATQVSEPQPSTPQA
jgi:hypothetical protein